MNCSRTCYFFRVVNDRADLGIVCVRSDTYTLALIRLISHFYLCDQVTYLGCHYSDDTYFFPSCMFKENGHTIPSYEIYLD